MSKKNRISRKCSGESTSIVTGGANYCSVDVQDVPARPSDKGRLHTEITGLNYIQK